MREIEPDKGDLKTTSALFFASELFFFSAITLVCLEIILLEVNISYISNCFLSASAAAWTSLLAGYLVKSRGADSRLIVSISLILGLISALIMLDYASTDTMTERKENLDLVKKKLIIGITVAAFSYVLGQKALLE